MRPHTPEILTGIGALFVPVLDASPPTVLDEQASDMRRRLSEYFWMTKATDKQKGEAKEWLYERLPDATKKETKKEYQNIGS